jgi:hypothetical protein
MAFTSPGRLNLVAKLDIFVHLSLLLLCLQSRAEVAATGRRRPLPLLLTTAPPVQGVEVCGGPDPGCGLWFRSQEFLCPAVLTSAQQGQQLKHGDRCKGQCHEMDIFFFSLNILINTFCVCADGFQGLSKKLFTTYKIINFLFSSFNLLTNFLKMRTETLLRNP